MPIPKRLDMLDDTGMKKPSLGLASARASQKSWIMRRTVAIRPLRTKLNSRRAEDRQRRLGNSIAPTPVDQKIAYGSIFIPALLGEGGSAKNG